MKSAYSYIRFSSPEQAKGDSFRRQSVNAAKWADKNGYQIVDELTDLGVSAYRGKNTKEGRLGAFLEMIKDKKIAEGSVLIVESLDRFSRSQVREVLPDFLNVINSGIGVVTLADGRLYDIDSLDKDNFALLAGLIVMTRAHEESERKGERVAAAWSRKRFEAREKSVPLTDRIPGWLIPERDGTGRRFFTEDKDKADIVRRIFAETDQGLGRRAIAKGLNREGRLSFLSETAWQPSSVIKIIRSRTAVGEYQPHRRGKDGKLMPDGDAIKGYYPVVIDEALWVRANAAVTVRRIDGGGRPSTEVANLLRGLAWCRCGNRMLFLNKGRPPKGGCYYVCSEAARDGKECSNKRLWNARNVERYLLHQIDPARVAAAFEPASEREQTSSKTYDLQLSQLTAEMRSALAIAAKHEGKNLGLEFEAHAETLIEQIAEVRKKRDAAASAERSRPHLPTIQSALKSFADLVGELAGSTPEEKVRLRTAILQQLRTTFAKIVFKPHAIAGLIELPGKPKTMKGPFGIPKPIEVLPVERKQPRYFFRHTFFSDDPDELAELGGGTGIISPRSIANV
jgi:DNA invertase Pin-like site-specific DNA recombinase